MKFKSNSRWELRLGLLQVLVLVGVVTGSMLGSFLIGYLSGNSVGYEVAQTGTVNTIARFPVQRNKDENDYVSEVYAKLNDKKVKNSDAIKAVTEDSAEIPVLKQDEGTSNQNEAESDNDSSGKADEEIALNVNVKEEVIDNAEIETGTKLGSQNDTGVSLDIALVGGDAKKTDTGPTLGSLLKEREKQDQEVVAGVDSSIEKVEEQPENKEQVLIGGNLDADFLNEDKKPEEEAPAAIKKNDEPPLKNDPEVVLGNESGLTEQGDKTLEVAPPQVNIKPGWYAQVLAPKELKEAEDMVSQLRAAGFPAVIEHAEVRGQKYYRVLVGSEDTRQQGEILVKQLKRERFLVGDPFLRLLR